MSDMTTSSPSAAAAAVRLKDIVIAGVLVLVALSILYVVLLDQGALLAPLLGDAARDLNYLHEFAHDGRHLFAAPCH